MIVVEKSESIIQDTFLPPLRGLLPRAAAAGHLVEVQTNRAILAKGKVADPLGRDIIGGCVIADG